MNSCYHDGKVGNFSAPGLSLFNEIIDKVKINQT